MFLEPKAPSQIVVRIYVPIIGPKNTRAEPKIYVEIKRKYYLAKVKLVQLFEKILVPLDGSEQSIWALGKAVRIAKKVGGEITLIHVYSIKPLAITPMQVYKYAQAMRKHGNGILEDGKKKAEAEGVQAQTLLVDGHAVHEILKVAREGNFSLIVIGATGLSKIRELLLGSVSDGVIRLAPCSVLVVR